MNKPNIHSNTTPFTINAVILISLIPTVILSVYKSGIRSLLVIAITIASAVLFEVLWDLALRKGINAKELGGAVTGCIVSLILPVNSPLWTAPIAAFFAVVIFQKLIGLTRRSFINPAAGAYLLMLVFFGKILGTDGTSICEQAMPTVIIGLAILVFKGITQLRIPITFVLSYFIASCIAPIFTGAETGSVILMQLTSGSLILSAVFIAAAYESSPITPNGRILYGVCCGIVTLIFNTSLPLTQSAMLAIVIMNVLSPIIERLTIPKTWRNN